MRKNGLWRCLEASWAEKADGMRGCPPNAPAVPPERSGVGESNYIRRIYVYRYTYKSFKPTGERSTSPHTPSPWAPAALGQHARRLLERLVVHLVAFLFPMFDR